VALVLVALDGKSIFHSSQIRSQTALWMSEQNLKVKELLTSNGTTAGASTIETVCDVEDANKAGNSRTSFLSARFVSSSGEMKRLRTPKTLCSSACNDPSSSEMSQLNAGGQTPQASQ
jgi:hypothetical protein